MAAAAAGAPPAALLAFLGEAPSEAALRRPDTAEGGSSCARGRGEDSSPDSAGPDARPCDDGGFDDDLIEGAPVPQPEPVASSAGSLQASSARKGREKRVLPPKVPPQDDGGGRPPGEGAGSSGGAAQAAPRPAASSRSRAEAEFGKTFTPMPASLAGMLGEAGADHAARSSTQHEALPVERRRGSTPNSRPTGSGGSNSSNRGGRPRSSSQRGGGERAENPARTQGAPVAPPGVAGVLDMDPLGSTSRRKFGGRG